MIELITLQNRAFISITEYHIFLLCSIIKKQFFHNSYVKKSSTNVSNSIFNPLKYMQMLKKPIFHEIWK